MAINAAKFAVVSITYMATEQILLPTRVPLQVILLYD